jgi:hypothetical protein
MSSSVNHTVRDRSLVMVRRKCRSWQIAEWSQDYDAIICSLNLNLGLINGL